MNNRVVYNLHYAFHEIGFTVLRFNFRGVGQSEGQFDDGYGETDDLFAVTEWVRRTRPGDELWLGGFSFGASVSLRAAQNLHLGQLISIAPPATYPAFLELGRPDCPWLVVMGDEDEVVRYEDVRSWVETVEPPPDEEAPVVTGEVITTRSSA